MQQSSSARAGVGQFQHPNEPRHEQRALIDYHAQHHHCLLCDYLKLERDRGERVVCANDLFTAVVPFWAIWPFETLLLSHRHFGSFAEMDNSERLALADILKRLTTRFDNLFKVSFPYSMGFHQSPTDGGAHPEQHFHAHFYPPLLRSATVRKFMVGTKCWPLHSAISPRNGLRRACAKRANRTTSFDGLSWLFFCGQVVVEFHDAAHETLNQRGHEVSRRPLA